MNPLLTVVADDDDSFAVDEDDVSGIVMFPDYSSDTDDDTTLPLPLMLTTMTLLVYLFPPILAPTVRTILLVRLLCRPSPGMMTLPVPLLSLLWSLLLFLGYLLHV